VSDETPVTTPGSQPKTPAEPRPRKEKAQQRSAPVTLAQRVGQELGGEGEQKPTPAAKRNRPSRVSEKERRALERERRRREERRAGPPTFFPLAPRDLVNELVQRGFTLGQIVEVSKLEASKIEQLVREEGMETQGKIPLQAFADLPALYT